MPSPFPGMDPYLESHWRDVHHSLITYTRAEQGLAPRRAAEEETQTEASRDFGRWLRNEKPRLVPLPLPFRQAAPRRPGCSPR